MCYVMMRPVFIRLLGLYQGWERDSTMSYSQFELEEEEGLDRG
jgi:hypothetical protein